MEGEAFQRKVPNEAKWSDCSIGRCRVGHLRNRISKKEFILYIPSKKNLYFIYHQKKNLYFIYHEKDVSFMIFPYNESYYDLKAMARFVEGKIRNAAYVVTKELRKEPRCGLLKRYKRHKH